MLRQHQTFEVTGHLPTVRRWLIERAWKPRAVARLGQVAAVLENRSSSGATPTAETNLP